MRKEVVSDPKQVYYRGCYWVAMTWSKVREHPAAGFAPGTEADRAARPVEVVRLETPVESESSAQAEAAARLVRSLRDDDLLGGRLLDLDLGAQFHRF